MVVNPSVPVKNVSEFIAYTKANSGKISMASFGTGTTSHLAGELFKTLAGVNMVHIPYRGSAPALQDLIGGRVEVMFDTLLAALPHIRSGALRGLALTTARRSELVPDMPTIGETLPGYEAVGWNGLAIRKGTPSEIIERLNGDINLGLADGAVRARLIEMSATPRPRSTTDFGTLMTAETEKWGKIVKFAGAKPD